jgi:hypothetical protein
MKVNLCLLISASFMIGCSANKATTLQHQNIDIQAGSSHQLVSAKTAEEYLYMAKVYEDKKNYEMAIIAYQKALLLEPNNTKGLTGLASAYAAQNLLTVAIPLFEKVVALEGNAKHYSNLGYAYYLNQQYEEAKRVLNQAVLMDPSYQQAKQNLALVDANYVAEKQVQALEQENKQVEYVTVNTLQNEQANTLVVLNNSSDNIQQSSSGIYELNFPKHTEDKPNDVKADLDTPIKETIKNDTGNSQQIIAAISGGITFKHVPVVSKLFDLASNGLVSFQLSANDKFVEVINGNGLKGIAKSVSEKLKERGLENIRIADAKRFNLAKTHIQYRTGYRDDAVNLNHNLLNRPYLMRNDNLPADVNVRLVLGRDLIANINHAELSLMEENELNS